ncbi:hypothetical protein BOTBODRAFT_128180 [Botryobasidium botryosum FD-172 SS1]|uniref:Uncharacterized protein n=1 Tax=Botryobasidium botryosum (strain FD-172 SS1) TaxID=930990 RepID=A0A067MQX1_BOTB1|nr:hypothetical protein BOTBODRAFT_128180 [Botryobasidium botryosum FD-172 SS1]
MFSPRRLPKSSTRTLVAFHLRARTVATSSRLSKSPYLVAPPHAVSNLRPVLYRTPPTPRTPDSQHPYSVDEFTNAHALAQGSPSSGAKARANEAWEEHWRMLDTDRFNHNFWLDCNTRFNAAKQSVIDSHRAMMQGSLLDVEAQQRALELSLSRFYKAWLDQEAKRQRTYTVEWYRRNYGGVWYSCRSWAKTVLSTFRL